MNKISVSIIILNWNGKKWLEKCLPTIMKVRYSPLEIIVVNNGSNDDSKDYIRKYFPKIKVIELQENVGYAKANNIGVMNAKGNLICLMNNDTTVTPGFLSVLVADMEKDPSIGIVQPMMRSMIHKDLLDSVGSFMTISGFLYHFGYMKPHANPLYHKRYYPYTVKGSCILLRRSEYLRLGGFDEDFECYVEEADLCHRILLSGKKVMYEPSVYVYHWGGGDMLVMSSAEQMIFRSYRNRIYSYFKNFELSTLLILLPVHIVFSEMFVIAAIITGQWKKAFAAQTGLFQGFRNIARMIPKRKYIQEKLRVIRDKDYLPAVTRKPRLSYFYYMFSDIRKYTDDP